MNLGLFVLRLVVGLVFLGHGTQKLFGWFGGGGPKGTGGFLDMLGYRPGRTWAILNGLAEAGGGLLLVLGWLTPFGAAAIVGVMLNAMAAVHAPKGFWNSNGGIEFPLTLAAASLALAFTGPGRFSLDRALEWHLRGTPWGLTSLGLAVVVAAAALGLRSRTLRRSARTGDGPGGAQDA